MKGFVYLGIFKGLIKLYLYKYIHTFIGVSIGFIICVLISIGYTPNELQNLCIMIGLKNFVNIDSTQLFTKFGMDTGESFMLILQKLFEAKNINKDITFKELYALTGKKLITVGTCINDNTAHYFTTDADPHMKILEACRITISLPILFTPVSYKNKLYMDGGCMDNFPIHLYKDDLDNVLGILISSKLNKYKNISNL